MSHDLLIVDDFLADPLAFREEVIRLPFYDIDFLGECYKRIHVRSTREHEAHLTRAVDRKLKQAHSLIRLNYENELPNHAIHSDEACAGFAAILYLNLPEQCSGGTAFWKHRETGYTHMPLPHEVKALGKSPQRVGNKLAADFNDEGAWEQTELAEMKFNRLIVYRANRFHSRYPFSAFGNSPETGRLIWTSFFECV